MKGDGRDVLQNNIYLYAYRRFLTQKLSRSRERERHIYIGKTREDFLFSTFFIRDLLRETACCVHCIYLNKKNLLPPERSLFLPIPSPSLPKSRRASLMFPSDSNRVGGLKLCCRLKTGKHTFLLELDDDDDDYDDDVGSRNTGARRGGDGSGKHARLGLLDV